MRLSSCESRARCSQWRATTSASRNCRLVNASVAAAQGFGYDFAIVLDPDAAKRQVGKGSYWWWGIAGTWFWIDPTNDVVFVGIIQRRSGPPGVASHEDISRRVIAEALSK